MPRPCTICSDEGRDEIDLALASGEPVRQVASKWLVSRSALARHSESHVRPGVARVQALVREQTIRQAQHDLDVIAELQRAFDRINLLFDACDRWLRDPEDPTRYDVSARADDVDVIYLERGPNKQLIRRKVKLSRLLARLEDAGTDVERAEVKHADIRDLVLKTADRSKDQLELIARLLGQLSESSTTVNVNNFANEWPGLRQRIVLAVRPYPEAHAAVLSALSRAKGEHNGVAH